MSNLLPHAATACYRQADQAMEQRAQAFAACVWTEMSQLGIVQTPRAYDLWFSHRSGDRPALSACIDQHVAQGKPLTAAYLDTLHAEFVAAAEIDASDVALNAEELEEAAETLVGQVAGSQASIKAYGNTLSDWAQRLRRPPTIGSLVTAIASLSADTAKASERNRVLEQQLAASIARIAKLRHALNTAKAEATIDSLTAITNRRAFDARLRRITAQFRAEPGNPVSVMLLDVDHFKRFNDTHGHQTGDLVLRLVARLLSESVKGRDTVARYGGEEFAIVLTGANEAAATIVARQICDAMAMKRLVQKSTKLPIGRITLSAGVAQLHPGDSVASLIGRADAALYAAKEAGRNRVCNATDFTAAAVA